MIQMWYYNNIKWDKDKAYIEYNKYIIRANNRNLHCDAKLLEIDKQNSSNISPITTLLIWPSIEKLQKPDEQWNG